MDTMRRMFKSAQSVSMIIFQTMKNACVRRHVAVKVGAVLGSQLSTAFAL